MAVAARARVLAVARVVGAAARVAGAAGHARRLDARRGQCRVWWWCGLAGVWQTWVAVAVATAVRKRKGGVGGVSLDASLVSLACHLPTHAREWCEASGGGKAPLYC